MTQAFNKKVKRQVYQIGDLVIKRIILPQGDPRGKWTPTYEGPFVVKKVFSGGAMMLATMDGEDFPHPVNVWRDLKVANPLISVTSDLYPCARFLRQGLPVCPRASQTLKPKATRLLLLLQANEIHRHKTRCLSEHTSPQPIGQPSYEDSDSHIHMRYVCSGCNIRASHFHLTLFCFFGKQHKINPHPLDKNYKSGSRRVLRMRRGANTFPSHNRLPNPRFGCETPSCPFLFSGLLRAFPFPPLG
ncbi:hypothetical protein KIW84_062157 [Lathyrus oleraceus]|uniref:Uncharacterized protein n=1 Tax=Pisum sativum TaxID=3888 RepID=A0A9D4W7N9_PEA|nr:hypothetical protein KIW84_062157 [Pisum sativum]